MIVLLVLHQDTHQTHVDCPNKYNYQNTAREREEEEKHDKEKNNYKLSRDQNVCFQLV